MSKELLENKDILDGLLSKEDIIKNKDITKWNFLWIQEKLDNAESLFFDNGGVEIKKNKVEIHYKLWNNDVFFDIDFSNKENLKINSRVMDKNWTKNKIQNLLNYNESTFINDLNKLIITNLNQCWINITDEGTLKRINEKTNISAWWIINSISWNDNLYKVYQLSDESVSMAINEDYYNYNIKNDNGTYIITKTKKKDIVSNKPTVVWQIAEKSLIYTQNKDLKTETEYKYTHWKDDNMIKFCDYMRNNTIDEKTKESANDNKKYCNIYPMFIKAYHLLNWKNIY